MLKTEFGDSSENAEITIDHSAKRIQIYRDENIGGIDDTTTIARAKFNDNSEAVTAELTLGDLRNEIARQNNVPSENVRAVTQSATEQLERAGEEQTQSFSHFTITT